MAQLLLYLVITFATVLGSETVAGPKKVSVQDAATIDVELSRVQPASDQDTPEDTFVGGSSDVNVGPLPRETLARLDTASLSRSYLHLPIRAPPAVL